MNDDTRTPGFPPPPPDDPSDRLLDAAVDALAASGPSDDESRQARRRAWERLQGVLVAPACADVQADLDAYRGGELPDGRAALVRDHLSECLTCRRAATSAPASVHARTGAAPTPTGRAGWTARHRRPLAWLAAAASFALVAVVSTILMRDREVTPDLRVAWVDGLLLDTTDSATHALAAGDVIGDGRVVRTGRGARAGLTLADGTLVELNERSEVTLQQDGPSTVLALRRGDVIVTAAKRHERTLQVRTDELTAAVKGTIFTVGHGLRGSRVAVLEGSVEVDGKLLEPGQQVTSREELERASLEDQVSWSRNRESYLALVKELDRELLAAAAELEKNPLPPNVRHSSELLQAMPADTVAYVALPNSPDQLERLSDVLTRRLSSNPTIAQWWAQIDANARAHGAPTASELVDGLQRFSSSLGDEIAIGLVLPAGPDGEPGAPVPIVTARVVDEDGFRSALADAFTNSKMHVDGESLQLLEGADLRTLAALGAPDAGRVAIAGEHVLLGSSAPLMQEVASRLSGERPSVAAQSPFLRSLGEHYRRGTEFLLAADLAGLVARVTPATSDPSRLRLLDPGNLQQLVVASAGDGDGRAVLSFRDRREGIASWLADPAPMGSLDFVSRDATAVLSVVFKDPAAMLADVQTMVDAQSFTQGLADIRREIGLDLARDVAEPLGGELTLALDGPLLPVPGWTLVVEVYDPTRLQATIEQLVDRANAERTRLGQTPIRLTQSATAEGSAWSLDAGQLGRPVAWTYRDGYLVATPGLGELEAALQARRLGRNFASSPVLLRTLRQGTQADVSFLVFQDFGATVGPLLGALESGLGLAAGPDAAPPQPRVPARGESAFLAQGVASDQAISVEFHAGGNPLARMLRQVVLHSLLQQAAASGELDRALGYHPDSTTTPR